MSKDNKPPDSAYKKASVYPGLVKPLDRAIQDAGNLYKGGYDVPDFNSLQKGAYGNLSNFMSLVGGASQDPIQYASQIGAGGWSSPGQSFLNSAMNPNAATGAYGNLLGQAQQGSGGLDAIRSTAGGAGLDVANNPLLQKQIASSNADITRDYTNAVVPGLEGRFAQTGTAGSPMEGWAQGDAQRNLADRLSSNTNNLLMGQYSAERGYQNQAQQALPGAWSGEIGTGLNAAQGYGSDLANRAGYAQAAGAGNRADIGTALGAGGSLAGMYSGVTSPLATMYGIGQQQQQGQERLNNSDWAGMQQYLNMLGQIGGTTNPGAGAQAMQGYQSQGQQTFGNMLALAGTGAMIFSDERLKEDIEPVGVGSGLYRWRYKGEEGSRHLGPMAQDVAEVAPSMVQVLNGMLAIPAALVER
jgi:hypothetical protein